MSRMTTIKLLLIVDYLKISSFSCDSLSMTLRVVGVAVKQQNDILTLILFTEAVKGFTPLYQDAPVVENGRGSPADLAEKEGGLRYRHLPESELRVVESILKGWHPLHTLPRLTARVVRIFISSTFTGRMYILIFVHKHPLLSSKHPLLVFNPPETAAMNRHLFIRHKMLYGPKKSKTVLISISWFAIRCKGSKNLFKKLIKT